MVMVLPILQGQPFRNIVRGVEDNAVQMGVAVATEAVIYEV